MVDACIPDPGAAATIDELTGCLRALKVWAGNPSFTVISNRINRAIGVPARRGTVVDCFKAGRRRIDADLVISIVRALHDDRGYVAQWRQALRVVGGRATAASQIRVMDALPHDLAEFTGRRVELRRLEHLAQAAGGEGFVASIEGMAGAGKTQFAVRLGHLLTRRQRFTTVLFVNLRGFHPDPNQPSADPAAVLEGFLRLLGVPAHSIPFDLAQRSAAFRDRLARRRALVVLDDAVDVEQIRPLVANVAGVVTLVTSRRRLRGLPAVNVPIDVFTVDEAREYLVRTVPDVAAGDDPTAVARIVQRCGGLALALSLVAGHMRRRPEWTLTDHADRLEHRHDARRLDSDVETALSVSYQNLPADRRRLLRLLALHPGPDLDCYAPAAMAGIGPDTARAILEHLAYDHLVKAAAPDRFFLHDLVRAFVTERGIDEDTVAERRDALTRLVEYYLCAGSAAMRHLRPTDVHLRPCVDTAVMPTPPLEDMWAARGWLDVERPAIAAVTAYAAGHGWPRHAVNLSIVFYRYLVDFPCDALQVHTNAREAAHHAGDAAGEAYVLLGVAAARCEQGQHVAGAADARRALTLFRSTGDHLGQARALHSLGNIALRQGEFTSAMTHMRRALTLFQRIGNQHGAANTLNSVGFIDIQLGRPAQAIPRLEGALHRYRDARHMAGEARVMTNLGNAEYELGRYERAAIHLRRAVDISARVADPICEAEALERTGVFHIRLGQHERASAALNRALHLFRALGNQTGEALTLNSLGDIALAEGDSATATVRYTAALKAAADVGSRDQTTRAQVGLNTAVAHSDDPHQATCHRSAAEVTTAAEAR
jgi:tetratricopeptide (TPR) repeat protein